MHEIHNNGTIIVILFCKIFTNYGKGPEYIVELTALLEYFAFKCMFYWSSCGFKLTDSGPLGQARLPVYIKIIEHVAMK